METFILGTTGAMPAPAQLASVRGRHKKNTGWGWRRLGRFKTINGRRYELHSTRGWKCIGREQV